jgi:uncharacterized phage protein gp47/JayE
MAYFAPYIDGTGLHFPTYQETLDYLNERTRSIFGNDIYLEPDSQDYQANAEVCDLWQDLAQLAQMVYNNRGTQFAQGAALDGLLKINGLKRLKASNSICVVTCSGTPGTAITNAYISDSGGDFVWSLEDTVIADTGEVDTIATCQTPGGVYADAGTLVQIVTQTRGWESVTNSHNAIPGKPVESDPAAKARQTISTARPSSTVLQGLTGGIAELPGVLRYRAYENDTNVPDANGIPGHSVCYVVEGGDVNAIADEIYLRKTPGCGTYGDVEVQLPPPNPSFAPPPPVRFFRPTYLDVHVKVSVKRRAEYVDAMAEQIQQAVSDFINSLDIGEDVSVSLLETIAQSVAPNLRSPAFTLSPTLPVLIGTDAADLTEADITIAFNAAAKCDPENVAVEEIT